MESIIQSQGTLWNIYPELLYQGLETGDQNSPLLIYAVQDYCDREGRERKNIYISLHFSQEAFHLGIHFIIKCHLFLFFSPCKYWK